MHRLRRTRCTPLPPEHFRSDHVESRGDGRETEPGRGSVRLPPLSHHGSEQADGTEDNTLLSLSLTTSTIRSSLILTPHTSCARGGSASLDVLTRCAHTYLSPQCKRRGVGGVGWGAMGGGARVVIWVKNCQEWGHVHQAFSVSLVGRRRSLVSWLVFLVEHSS